MENNRDVTLNDLQETMLEIKQNLCWLYDIMNKEVKESRETVEEVKWMARKMGNQDSKLEYNHKDLYELMGTIDNIKKYVENPVNMNQCSHFQDSPARDHPMEETLVVQPVTVLGEKQQK